MPTTQTTLPPPPLQSKLIDPKGYATDAFTAWLFTEQTIGPLRAVDTSGGSYAENVPPAGSNSTTGQSNQNQEITYVKSSADANVFTLNGVEGGPYTLTAQYSSLKIKSDGTNWWKVG